MKKLRLAVIGAGGIAAKLHFPELQELRDRCEVTLISGRREQRLRLLQQQFEIARHTTKSEEVISDPNIDAVIIALPHPQHVQWGLAALHAGKHVLMQKPLCASMEEADAFVAAATASDRTVLCMPHFPSIIPTMRQQIDQGVIGRVSGAHARTSHAGPEVYYREVREIFGETDEDLWFFDAQRASVGALFDMGVYAVAHLVALLGSMTKVTAVVTTFDKPTALEDNATLIMQTRDGGLATAETSWCDGARTWELSVHGTAGKFVLPASGQAMLSKPLAYDSDHAPIAQEPVVVTTDHGNVHSHFLDCIDRSAQPPLSNAFAARHVTEILLAGLESGRSGQTVPLQTFADR